VYFKYSGSHLRRLQRDPDAEHLYVRHGVSNLLPVFDVPGFTGPYWGNLVLGMVYLVAAVYAAFTKRSLQVTDFSEFVPPVQTPEINREHALSDA